MSCRDHVAGWHPKDYATVPDRRLDQKAGCSAEAALGEEPVATLVTSQCKTALAAQVWLAYETQPSALPGAWPSQAN